MAKKQVKSLWAEHIGYFVDYVNATNDHDENARQEALKNLDNYREHFSQFLASATDEKLEAKGLSEGLQMHVNQLVSAFDASVKGTMTKLTNTKENPFITCIWLVKDYQML